MQRGTAVENLEAHLQLPIDINSSIGGTYSDNDYIFLIGTFQNHVLEIKPSVQINKFTSISLNVLRDNAITESTMCIFQSEQSSAEPISVCIAFGYADQVLELGEMFISKGMPSFGIIIDKISFHQASALPQAETALGNIQLLSTSRSSMFDEKGYCLDPNSVTIIAYEKCACSYGYVSSGGGKIFGEDDSCVSCLVSIFCHFEGQYCETNDECFDSVCENNICKQNVSSMYAFKYLSFKSLFSYIDRCKMMIRIWFFLFFIKTHTHQIMIQ